MIYLDTLVAPLSLLGQPGADETTRPIMGARTAEGLISSRLLTVEMVRATHREHLNVLVVDELTEGVELVEIGPNVIERASALTDKLKSLDAIHLVIVTLLDDPHHPVMVLTHDIRLADAVRSRGPSAIDLLGS